MTDVAQFNTGADWKARGFRLQTPPLMLACYDPAGDGADRDALLLLSREEHQKGEPHDPDFAAQTLYRVLMVHQMAAEMEFPDKLAMILRLHRQLRRWTNKGRCHGHVFCVETNGVGYAMGSALRSAVGNAVVAYHTTGKASSDVPFAEKRPSMPRLPALDNLRVLAETHCLKIARDAPGREILVREMEAFVWRRAGRPEAMDGQRDDTVMALAGGCWVGSKIIPPILKAKRYSPQRGRVS